MKIFQILAFLIIIACSSNAQEKYLIFFKDKGTGTESALTKKSALYEKAKSMLSERAIARRTKAMGEESIIKYEDLPVNEDYVKRLERSGIEIIHRLNWFNAISAGLTSEQLGILSQMDFVKKVEKVRIFKTIQQDKTFYKPAVEMQLDPDYGQSFEQVNMSGIPFVHKLGIFGQGVIIGVLDSGFNWKEHESLNKLDVIGERDFVFNDGVTANQPGDDASQDSHGTYVLSILGGHKKGRLIGPAYKAKFILAKTEDIRSERHIEEDNYAAALEWMEAMGVDITTSSLGYNDLDSEPYAYKDMDGKTAIVTKAVELAFSRGVLTFTSAGNEGAKSWKYMTAPADGFNVISVGAVTSDNKVAAFSSRGPTYDGRIKPEIVCMGVNVYGADRSLSSTYQYNDGTSSACPIASGSAALLLSLYSHISNVEARKLLLEKSENYPAHDNDRGYGLLKIDRVVQSLFPALNSQANSITLSKYLITNSLAIKPNTLNLQMALNSSQYKKVPVKDITGNNCSIQIDSISANDTISFYYTYELSDGRAVKDPSIGNYSLIKGQDTILLRTGQEDENLSPSEYSLSRNYPNPFNSSTNFVYNLPVKSVVKLKLYDLLGREVMTLFEGERAAGKYVMNFSMDKFTSGVYFIRIETPSFNAMSKVIYLK